MKCACFCPELSDEEFAGLDLQEVDLSGRTFCVSRTPMVSHFPLNPELKIEKTMREIERKGYQTVAPFFAIFEDGLLSGKVMIEIVKPTVKDSDVMTLTELKLVGKIFAGPKHLVPKALKQFDGYLMGQRILTTDYYFWYHSCKNCEKEKGPRTVIFGKVK